MPLSATVAGLDAKRGCCNGERCHISAVAIALSSTIMSNSQPKFSDDPDSDILQLIVETVFVPPKLPQKDAGERTEQMVNVALCDSLVEAMRDFLPVVPSSERPSWMKLIKMMKLVRCTAEGPFAEAELQHVFSNMEIGGMSI